jgi:hypothetical protein
MTAALADFECYRFYDKNESADKFIKKNNIKGTIWKTKQCQ